jgi:CubicO group peptidase (beta-lactamase class C family)
LRGQRSRSSRWWPAPGTRFDYGSTHLHVAARMAEVVTGQSWANLFATQLKAPLGLTSPDLAWYTAPRQAVGHDEPADRGRYSRHGE